MFLILCTVFSLIILEGLLSVDNALVLAVMVKHLPEKQQKKALFYGIYGAMIFRLIAILIGTILISIWWIKIAGGLYLLWLVVKYFKEKNKEQEETQNNSNKSFWKTVFAIELMDIAFSVDSILASLGVSNQVWVLYVGGILGILMMRGVAQFCVKLLSKVPELETTAYILIAVIGLRMLGSAFGFSLSDIFFFAILGLILIGTFVVSNFRKRMFAQ